MKIKNFSLNVTQQLLTLLAVFLLLSTVSCAKKTTFNNSTIIPAARGDVAVKQDKNNNYNITVKISYLAEPERLTPPKTTYVVWMVSENNNTVNLGQIIGTSKLHVTFETVSSFKPVQIFVTAENEADVRYPGPVTVLATDTF